MTTSNLVLVGDIGGTNARFALADAQTLAITQTGYRRTADFAGIEEAIRSYLAEEGANAAPTQASIAVACPVGDDAIRLTNNHWRFSQAELKRNLGLGELHVINDFTAQALAVPHVPASHITQVGSGKAISGAPIGVLGPGTGLGVSGLIPAGNGWTPLSGEGGHVGIVAENEQEFDILRFAWKEFGRTSLERLICGSGIVFLYRAMAHIRLMDAEPLEAADVVSRALEGDALCRDTLNQFCAFLGGFAGDVALILGARGGVYIAGGIIPRFMDFFAGSPFRERFENKGRFRDYTTSIPTFVITPDENPALVGAASVFHR
ncbi:MAG: glucokinase [Alphaproteobacteria bacterium]|nr:glucokinase [Alphaproteobacteria bacterium]